MDRPYSISEVPFICRTEETRVDFRGTYTALVTPFKNKAVDEEAWAGLIDLQKGAGIAGIVPCGCTGEAATLSDSERRRLLDVALERAGDALQVIAGTGTNDTASTIALTKEAEAAGAHAAMLITPYYNKPSQAGLLEHYRRVGDATSIPLILYNVPGRTGVTLAPATIAALHETGRYPAIKEAAGSLDAVSDIRAASPITILSGDDPLTVPMISLGARGVVSVVSNLVPEMVRDMVAFALAGNNESAAKFHFRLLPLMRAAFIESNPSPIKAMLNVRGLIENELRSPLAPVSAANMRAVRGVLDDFAEAGSMR
jgi:4-hydroxy-tetrahydrodipicolinate synthase